MKYQTPEIIRLGPAVDVIQNPLNKEVQQILETPYDALGSIAAYAADE